MKALELGLVWNFDLPGGENDYILSISWTGNIFDPSRVGKFVK